MNFDVDTHYVSGYKFFKNETANDALTFIFMEKTKDALANPSFELDA